MPSTPEWNVRQRIHRLISASQCRGGVGGEERVARARGEDHHPPLLEVANGPPPNVRLGDRRHRDGRLHARGLPHPFEHILERQAVDDGGEHAHVVGLGAVHARARARHPPPDVAAAHDDGHLDAELGADLDDLRSQLLDDLAVDAVALVAGECFARNFQEDPVPARTQGFTVVVSVANVGTTKRRSKPGRIAILASPRICLIVCFSSRTNFCSSSTDSRNQPSSLPSTIFAARPRACPRFE